jgi:PAS domain S-box-containing protein
MNHLSTDAQLDLLLRSLDALPRGVLITDCEQYDDPIIYVNDFFLQMSGYSREEVLGKNCRFMQGEKTDPETVKQLSLAIQNRQPITVTMLNYSKDGETFWNEFTISPVKDSSGNVTHCIGLEKRL